MNFSFLLRLFAATRMRSRACDASARPLCPGRAFAEIAFPSVPGPSAPPAPPPARRFCSQASTATSAESRLLPSVHRRLRLLTFPTRSGDASAPGWARDLPVPEQRASAHARVSDSRRAVGTLALSRSAAMSPSVGIKTSAARDNPDFRGSMAGLCAPLPTLRLRPRERKRTAWGRCGSLLLHRIGLAPITPCRSPGAQSPQLHQEVRASRHDFLDRRITRHSCGLRSSRQSVC